MEKHKMLQDLKGHPVILLDYETGEYIDTYPSISEVSEDLDIPYATVCSQFSVVFKGSCVGRMPKYQTLIIKKSALENLLRTMPSDMI